MRQSKASAMEGCVRTLAMIEHVKLIEARRMVVFLMKTNIRGILLSKPPVQTL